MDRTAPLATDVPTLQTLFRRACRKYGNDPLATFDGESISYAEAWERAGALASALADIGVEKGDRVGLMMSNRLGYVIADLACVRGGYVKVAMNDMLTRAEYEHIVSDSAAKAVIADEEFLDTAVELADETPTLEAVVALGESAPESVFGADRLIEKHSGTAPDVEVAPDDTALFQYTGGTTGKPKGAKHTHYGLATGLLAHVIELDIEQNERMLLMTPLPHSAGYALAAGMIRGVHAYVTQGFDPGSFLTHVQDKEVTWSWMVPTMIYRVLDHERLSETDVSSLETLVYGGAPIARDRLKEALDVFGQVFIQLYGQSEIPNIGTTLPKADHAIDAGEKLDSCGRETAMADVRIAPIEDRTDTGSLPRGEEGEILLRAPYRMTEYHGLPEKTADTVVDGWIRTGDIGRMDDDGYVYLLDRDSDMIITGGLNVYTTNVEDELVAHPDLKDVAVIGVPHDDWGEAVHAVVIPTPGADLTAEDVRSFAEGRLADYKKPKSVEFVEEFPTTPYGKVDKKALREPHWEDEDREVA